MIAIVPARGGSKGLPGKNIKNLHGKPMIAYTIEEARKSKYIEDIIISTDDQSIADIAVSLGALCHFLRPCELATDNALAVDNYIYTINRLNSDFGYDIDEFIVLQPTSPLRKAEDIDNAIEMFMQNNADSVISFVEETHPISWHKYINDDGKLENIFPDNIKNRQDNKISYYPNGAIFIFKISVLKNKIYYTENTYAYVMSKSHSVDVDTIDDFEYASFMMGKTNE